jgi:hypothetical protein
MPRFFVSILSRAHADADGYRPLYEETFLIVDAASLQLARETAEGYGRAAEHDYVAGEGHRVFWRFVEVTGVTPCIDEDVEHEVVELGGRFFRDKESYDRLRDND